MIQKNGADIFVVGAAIIDQDDPRGAIIKMKDLAKKFKQS